MFGSAGGSHPWTIIFDRALSPETGAGFNPK
jgi:hypothetical protein